MEKIDKSIEIERPLRTVYNQWTQFEDFPLFMEGVKKVIQLDDQRLHWEAEIGGKNKECDVRIRIKYRIKSSPGRAKAVSIPPET